MNEHRATLERELERLSPPRIPFDQLARRRDRKRRDQRIRAGALGLAITVALAWLGASALRAPERVPADDLGIFTDVRGWLTYSEPAGEWYGDGFASGIWAVDPANPDGEPLLLDASEGYPVAWSSDGSKLLINRRHGTAGRDNFSQSLLVLNADGTETPIAEGVWISGGSFSPDGSEVVYAGYTSQEALSSGEPSGIYVVDADGGGSPELLYAAAEREYGREGYPAPDVHQTSVYAASLSPDGSRIAYIEGMGDWGNSVWVMDIDGTDQRQIIGEEVYVHNFGPLSLQWSPDGTRLVVEALKGFHVVGADGAALTRVTRGQDEAAPYWSPDGSRIAFQRYEDVTQAPDTGATLYSMAPDGSDVRSLGYDLEVPGSLLGPWNPLAPEAGDAVTPTPSPTDPSKSITPTSFRRGGEFIVFAPSTTGAGWDLAAQDPETGDVRTIVETNGLADCVAGGQPCTTFIMAAEWSADGRWVAFRVTHRSVGGGPLGPCAPTVGLWIATADGEPRQLTTPCDEPPSASDVGIEELWAWSPVGDRLAYARIGGDVDELFLIDPSDGTATSLVTGNIDPFGGWSGLAWSSLAWSPDGSQIAYAEGGSVYAVSVESGERSRLADAFDDIIDIAWAPDGGQILVRDQELPLDQGRDLYRMQVMNADGSDLHVALEGVDACCRSEWSPDGRRIVYELPGDATADSDFEVWTISSSGSDRIKVFDSDGCEMGPDLRSVWSPDGSQVAFIGCGGDAMVADADGTGTPQPIDELVWRGWYGGGLGVWDLAGIAQL